MSAAKAIAFIIIVLGFILFTTMTGGPNGQIKRIEILPDFVYPENWSTTTAKKRTTIQKKPVPENSDFYPPPRETKYPPAN